MIKRADAARLARDAVVLDLADIAQQAEVILSSAQREAESIVAQARAERERLLSDAREVGHGEGYERGLADGRAAGEAEGREAATATHGDRLAQLEAGWAAALEEFLAQRDHLVIACKHDVLRLVLSLASRVVHRVIETDEGVVASQLEAALRLIAAPTRVVIAIHPDDAAVASGALPALVSRIRSVEDAALVEDESVSRGSCVVRTAGGGVIDATVETQLDRIASLLVPDGPRDAADLELTGDAAGRAEESERGDLAA